MKCEVVGLVDAWPIPPIVLLFVLFLELPDLLYLLSLPTAIESCLVQLLKSALDMVVDLEDASLPL